MEDWRRSAVIVNGGLEAPCTVVIMDGEKIEAPCSHQDWRVGGTLWTSWMERRWRIHVGIVNGGLEAPCTVVIMDAEKMEAPCSHRETRVGGTL